MAHVPPCMNFHPCKIGILCRIIIYAVCAPSYAPAGSHPAAAVSTSSNNAVPNLYDAKVRTIFNIANFFPIFFYLFILFRHNLNKNQRKVLIIKHLNKIL